MFWYYCVLDNTIYYIGTILLYDNFQTATCFSSSEAYAFPTPFRMFRFCSRFASYARPQSKSPEYAFIASHIILMRTRGCHFGSRGWGKCLWEMSRVKTAVQETIESHITAVYFPLLYYTRAGVRSPYKTHTVDWSRQDGDTDDDTTTRQISGDGAQWSGNPFERTTGVVWR